jgi:tetratricopeptide (TPR) repeat protein
MPQHDGSIFGLKLAEASLAWVRAGIQKKTIGYGRFKLQLLSKGECRNEANFCDELVRGWFSLFRTHPTLGLGSIMRHLQTKLFFRVVQMKASTFFVLGLVASFGFMGCGRTKVASVLPNPGRCVDAKSQVELFWSPATKAEVDAGIFKAGGEWTKQVSARVLPQIDQITREWAKQQEGICKDTFERGVMSHEAYLQASNCLQASLHQQRTLVEALKYVKVERLLNVDATLSVMHQDTIDCEREVIFTSFDEAKDDTAATEARLKLAEARVYGELRDERAAQANVEAKKAAEGSRSARLKVVVLVADAWALHDKARFEDALTQANQALQLAQAQGYELGTASALSALGRIFRGQRDYPRSLSMYQQALAIREKILGPEHPNVSVTYTQMSDVYRSQRDYASALQMYQKDLAARLKSLGPMHPIVATTYNNMGVVYSDLMDYSQALAMHQKDLAIRIAVLGPDHPSVATTYNNMGVIYEKLGDYPGALSVLQKALDIGLTAFGPEYRGVGTTYNNMGVVFQSQGDYPRALSLFQKGLAIVIKADGPEHLDVATTYNSMGAVYWRQGNYPSALSAFQKALGICLNSLDPEHPEVATIYDNMGLVHQAQGDHTQALVMHQLALDIKLKALGPEHLEVAATFNNLGLVYWAKADFPRALSNYQKALDIKLKAVGPEHTSIASNYNNLGAVYQEQGDGPRALSMYQKALDIKLKAAGATHPDVATIYANIGFVYSTQKDYSRALSMYQQARAIYLKAFSPEHPHLANVKRSIGSLCKAGYRPACSSR